MKIIIFLIVLVGIAGIGHAINPQSGGEAWQSLVIIGALALIGYGIVQWKKK